MQIKLNQFFSRGDAHDAAKTTPQDKTKRRGSVISNLTLSRKILFVWTVTIVTALVSTAVLFNFLLSRYNEAIAKEQLSSSYISLHQQLDNHITEMTSQAEELAVREDIINSMNFISKYQNKRNYDAIAFDGEKKRLANQLSEISTDYTEISFYDWDQEVIALKYCDPDDTNHFAITSYRNGKATLFSRVENKSNYLKTSLWDDFHIYKKTPEVTGLILSEINGTIHADIVEPIIRGKGQDKTNRVGMVHIGDNFSKYVSVIISPLIGLPAELYSREQIENILSPFQDGMGGFEKNLDSLSQGQDSLYVETATHYWSIHPFSLQKGFTAYIALTIDKKELDSQFNTLMTSAMWVMFIMVIFLLPMGVWFIHRIITHPIQILLDGVERVSGGKYDTLESSNNNDELGSLARSFEAMAKDVQIREQKLADILELAPEGIIAINEQFKITLFNKGAERVFGYSAKEVKGKSLNILLPKPFRRKHNKYIRSFDSSQKSYSRMGRRGEIAGLHKNGEEFPASASISKLVVGNEKVYTVLIQDITERKNAEEAILAAKLDAEMANESKSHFLASMSHELRTPLNAIIGMSDMIKEQYFGELNDKYKEYAGDIVHSGEHLLSLVNELLDISTIEAGKHTLNIQSFSIEEMVKDCIKIVKLRASQKAITLLYDIPKTLPPLVADKQAVRKILINLLSNAIKFMPGSGTVDVSASEGETSITIVVKDDGPGIPKDKISDLTKPFARLESNAHMAIEGWGLGLAISKSLMEMHGGTIKIESIENEGTSVYITFIK